MGLGTSNIPRRCIDIVFDTLVWVTYDTAQLHVSAPMEISYTDADTCYEAGPWGNVKKKCSEDVKKIIGELLFGPAYLINFSTRCSSHPQGARLKGLKHHVEALVK